MPWNEIIGQEYALKVLKDSLESDRVHQAYLFYGPPGVGKGLAARVFAQALNCQELQGDGCGRCPNCRLIEDGTHPDVLKLVPTRDVYSIDQVRQIKKGLSYKPIMGKRKICILQEVERLTIEAANALLLSLEEPPPGATFIMSTTNPHNLLPTIRSRCQRIRFKPLYRKKVEEILCTWGISKETASLIATLSEGSLGKAKEYLDREIVKKQEVIINWLKEIEEGGPLDVFEVANKIASEEGEILEILDIILYILRSSLGSEAILPIMERVIEIEKGIRSHINLTLALEVMFLEYQNQVKEEWRKVGYDCRGKVC